MARRRWAGAGLALALTATVLFACDKATLAFEVDSPRALADQPVRIRVTGASADGAVVVEATGTDRAGRTWRASADFRADHAGVVDLSTSPTASGSYRGVDAMGLFWSMNPDGGDGDSDVFVPTSSDGGRSYEIRLSAAADGRAPASTTVRRVITADGVTKRVLDRDGIVGTLFTPPDGAPRRPGVLLIGGSEGGSGPIADAALLASHGYPSLAVGYFHEPGLPQTLKDIPMEYFATAARLLGKEPSVAGPAVVAWGYSRGTEAAMLLAEYSAELVRGVILYAPTDRVGGGFPDGGFAWTHDGQPVPLGPLPVVHVAGPVLAIAGGTDEVWASYLAAPALRTSLDGAHPDQHHVVLAYRDAGHLVGTFPYYPSPVRLVHPVTKRLSSLGGSRPADEAARADGYPKVLAFLNELATVTR